MSEYQLHCFAQSGNAYRAALMLNLIRADWEPVFVDFFGKMVQRSPEWRGEVNEMGEAPVLVHGERKLSQSGVILTYLSEKTGHYHTKTEDDRLEALRWLLFDNQKVNGFHRPLSLPALDRQAAGRSEGAGISERPHRQQSRHRREAARERVTGCSAIIRPSRDISMCGYMYYPAGRAGLRHSGDLSQHRQVARAHQGPARLETSLRSDAGTSAAGAVTCAARARDATANDHPDIDGMTFRPVTAARWKDLEDLFESRGGPKYCWCMAWRATSRAASIVARPQRKSALKAASERRIPIGILGYLKGAAGRLVLDRAAPDLPQTRRRSKSRMKIPNKDLVAGLLFREA